MLFALILGIMATAYVNYQVSLKKMSHDVINDQKAFYMADAGIQKALCSIARDPTWQGQDRDYTEWVYNDNDIKYGFNIRSIFRGPDYDYIVISTGAAFDVHQKPPFLLAQRCLSAIIHCDNDYNPDHAQNGDTRTHYTLPGSGGVATILFVKDLFR